MNEEILFGSSYELTARQEFVFDVIEKSRDLIINSCTKCDKGFIDNKKPGKSIEDLAHPVAKACSCRIKAARVSKLIESGIPKHFLDKRDIDLPIDAVSKENIDLYVGKIDKVYEQCIGILFLNSNVKAINISYANQLAAIKILLAVLDSNKYTAHYIDMNRYFDLRLKLFKGERLDIENFIAEVEAVDFLCIDHVNNVNATEYVKNTFFTLLSERALHGKPTILVTSFDESGLTNYLGHEIMGQIVPVSIKIMIKSFSGKEDTYINLKRKVG